LVAVQGLEPRTLRI